MSLTSPSIPRQPKGVANTSRSIDGLALRNIVEKEDSQKPRLSRQLSAQYPSLRSKSQPSALTMRKATVAIAIPMMVTAIHPWARSNARASLPRSEREACCCIIC